MYRTNKAAVAALMGGLLAIAPAARGDEKAELDGGYTIVAGEKFGEVIPAGEIKGTTVRIADNGIIVADKDKKDVYASSYKLEPGDRAGCYKITLTSKLSPNEGAVAKGLIEKKGDTVRLIYALPGGDEPTEFKTKSKQLMFEMKNLRK